MLYGDEVYDPDVGNENGVDGDRGKNDAEDANDEGTDERETDENRPDADEGSDPDES